LGLFSSTYVPDWHYQFYRPRRGGRHYGWPRLASGKIPELLGIELRISTLKLRLWRLGYGDRFAGNNNSGMNRSFRKKTRWDRGRLFLVLAGFEPLSSDLLCHLRQPLGHRDPAIVILSFTVCFSRHRSHILMEDQKLHGNVCPPKRRVFCVSFHFVGFVQ